MSAKDKNKTAELAALIYEQRRILDLIEALYNEINLLQRALVESSGAMDVLKMYRESSESSFQTMLPIGGSVYLPVTISKPKTIVVGVGAGVFIESSIEDAINYLQRNIDNLNKAINERNRLLEQLRNRYNEITARITELQFVLSERKE